jgi:hypothetical protein
VPLPTTDQPPCLDCGQPHRTDRCQAHAKARGGGQCQGFKVPGLSVCVKHGGRTAASQAKSTIARAETAAARTADAAVHRRIRMVMGAFPDQRIENPLQELQLLAGEMRQWKQAMAERVADLLAKEKLRYGTDGGEAIRGEILLYERAMERLANTLAMIAKLNIDERLVKIAEGQRDMVLAAIEAALTLAGVTGAPAVAARQEAARYLRVVASTTEPAQITAD